MSISWRLKRWAEQLRSREKGVVYKQWDGRLRVALVYPNTYTIGMSNLGFQTVYRLFNQCEEVACERVFLPESGIWSELLRTDTPLFSLESLKPLYEFDIIAFSISFEEDYLHVPDIMSLSRIPVLSSERESPLIIGGGAVTFINPEPIGDFFDAFYIGEGEEKIGELIDILTS